MTTPAKTPIMATMYPGGKNRHYQTIINQIPPHQVYIETHLGSGAILRHKRPAAVSIGLDLNPLVIAAHIEATGKSTDGTRAPLGKSTDEIRIRSQLATANLPIAAARDPLGKYADMVHQVAPAKLPMGAPTGRNTVASAPSEMPILHLICQDAQLFLREHHFTGHEFIYADPPYIMDTRSSQRPLYTFEYTEQDHINLLSCLVALPCPVMVSGYWSELYNDMLTGWRSLSFTSYNRAGNQTTEWLWMNYPEPTRLHDYTHLGENYRKRDDLKRKKQRWLNRLKKMDILERRAILWAIEESGING